MTRQTRRARPQRHREAAPRRQPLRRGRLVRLLGCTAALLLAGVSTAEAKPFAPDSFCQTYPAEVACLSTVPACTLCHQTTNPVVMNSYGSDVAEALAVYVPPPFDAGTNDAFNQWLPQALRDIELLDSDGDGHDNLAEIEAGSNPGDEGSFPHEPSCPEPEEVADLDYKICQLDHRYAYRKVGLDFCGLPPTFAEMEAFMALDEAGQLDELHAKLDACLDSEFWLGVDGVLWGVAHRKIKPVGSLIDFANFVYDYEYFTYTQIDDHDVRDVLVGQYLVERVDTGTAEAPQSVYQQVDSRDDQPLQPERRVGMVTTAWPLFYNTMFTALPRGTAAQAYRAFLGFDIAQSQGLSWPVAGEPADYDDAGVTTPTCAACHSTLDPLSYPFATYNGLQQPFYTYNPNRIANFVPLYPKMATMPEAGVILGEPVADLLEWAQVAASSDAFFMATTTDYWRLLMGEEPKPENAAMFADYTTLWQGLKQHHSVESMLHALIETEAYGAP